MNQKQFNMELDADKMEKLYKTLRDAVQDHVGTGSKDETPNRVYEAIDALALVTAEVWASVHNAIGGSAAETARKYFKERSTLYANALLKKEGKNSATTIINVNKQVN